MNASVDYYEILNCAPTSSLEELRRNYKSLVLRYHPDKREDVESEGYLLITKAWKTLSDPILKKEYDEQMKQRSIQTSHVIYATLNVNELDIDSSSGVYSYDCRCGGLYRIGATYLKSGSTVIPCDDCSMAIVVNAAEMANDDGEGS